jgi:RNA polymerase primary sigma factor
VWWVRQCILTAIAEQGRTLRIPSSRKREINLLAAAYRRLAEANQSQPSADEVAAEAGLQSDRVRDLVAALAAPLSLDAPQSTWAGDGLLRELGELIADRSAEQAATRVEDRDRDLYLRERLATLLRPRERHVLERYFGLDGGEGATLEQIGDELGVSRERVRQIKEAAIKKMRADPYLCALQ